MYNLISGEIYKTFKSKITWVVIGILALLGVFMTAFFAYGKATMSAAELQDMGGYQTYITSYDMDLVFIIIALFMGTMITNEYVFGSIRQIVSRGFSRVKIVISQYIALSLVLSVIMIIAALIYGGIATCFCGLGDIDIVRFLMVTLGYCSMVFGYGALSMFLAYLFKSGGLCLGINTILVVGGGIGMQILSYVTKQDIFVKYWISNLRSNVSNCTLAVGEQFQYILAFVVIGIVFMFATVVLFNKRDVD